MLAAEFRKTISPVAASPVLRRLLSAFAVSAVGGGMSTVGVAWLAIRIAPSADSGMVGLAAAAYTLPGADRAVLLARPLRLRSKIQCTPDGNDSGSGAVRAARDVNLGGRGCRQLSC